MQKALEAERERLDKRMAERVEEQRQLHMTTNEALQMRINKLEAAQQAEQAEELTESDQERANVFFAQGISTLRHAPKVKKGFWHSSWRCQICKARAENQGLWTCATCKHVQRNIDRKPASGSTVHDQKPRPPGPTKGVSSGLVGTGASTHLRSAPPPSPSIIQARSAVADGQDPPSSKRGLEGPERRLRTRSL